MTVDQLVGKFWETVGESPTFGRQPGYGSGPTAKVYVWQGFCEMVKRCKPSSLRKLHPFDLEAGTEQYSMPADFLCYQNSVEEPITIAGRQLQMKEQGVIRALRDNPTASWSGVGTTWWYDAGRSDTAPFARKVGFFPVPSVDGTAYMPYVRKPLKLDAAGLTGGMEYPDIDEMYHMAAPFFGVYLFYLHQPELPAGVDPEKYLAIGERMMVGFNEVHAEKQAGPRRYTVPFAGDFFTGGIEV